MKIRVSGTRHFDTGVLERVFGISRIRLYANYVIEFLINNFIPPSQLKNRLLSLFLGAKIHKTAYLAPDVVVDPVAPELITIEEDVFLGWGARIFVHMISPCDSGYDITIAPVRLKKGCFIGGYTTIRPGVTVGKNAVVGSDSLVLKDIPDGQTVCGVPARPLEKKSKR